MGHPVSVDGYGAGCDLAHSVRGGDLGSGGELGGIPASAEGLDELDGGGHLADLEGDLGLLVGEQGGLGADDVEVGVEAGLVARGGDVDVALGGVDGLLLADDLLGGDAEGGDVVFDLLEGGEDGLTVGGDVGGVLGGVLGGGGAAEAGVEEGLGGGGTEGPEEGWRGEEVGDVRGLEAAAAGEIEGGVVGGLFDADEGVGLGHGAFGGGDIGAALKQLGGQAERDGRGGGGGGADGDREGRGGFADEGGDGVFVDGAVLGDADAGLLGVLEGDFGLGGGLGAVDAGLDEDAGEVE